MDMYRALLGALGKEINIVVQKNTKIEEVTGELVGLDEYLSVVLKREGKKYMYSTRYIIRYSIRV